MIAGLVTMIEWLLIVVPWVYCCATSSLDDDLITYFAGFWPCGLGIAIALWLEYSARARARR